MVPYPASTPNSRDDLAPSGPGSLPTIWTRVGARLFDSLVTSIPSLVLAMPYIELGPGGEPSMDMPRWAQVLGVVIPLVYEFVFLAAVGASPGKMVFGIRIVAFTSGAKARFDQCAFRVLLPGLGSVLGLLSTGSGWGGLVAFIAPVMYLSAVYDPLQRGLHDKAAGTIVVRTQ